ncbi:MAG: PilZ domain-containing protein [Gammaproteobacteria bacterium]|nr:PilZ domain-containing protein [Gammaproteobacteria bacterium]
MLMRRNRRKFARYGVGSLGVSLHRAGLLSLFSSRIDVRAIDFNATGLAFRHSRPLNPGQPVLVDLMTDQHSVSGVVAVVRYVTRMENHFRCGVEFDFEANAHMRSVAVRDTLTKVETLLNEVVILTAE